MTAALDLYLNEKFLGLKLESPLFYNADVGIRYEIGNPDPSVSDEKYREQVHYRSTTLFKSSHQPSDELFIVLFLDVQTTRKPYKINVFRKGVKHKNTLKNLSCSSVTLTDEEEAEGWESYRFVLSCKASDIKPITFLFSDYRIFIVNQTRDTIFYLYDSRGLDIVSNAAAPLKELYIRYNHWILDYDRAHIASIFNNGNSNL
ncbi:DUF3885 domain-containing protein [Paenibacillus radicis (ex Gao et al. 2016)]|uniref:DUF3885 domain-containing protein n=1 Tax=Paenibacillus radicis (ex Gao et al. 2016) TaxID=1737354 RepID=A0A917GX12_9BACL|nr:DUF3885 domain-containing protein [Paenibacillus radicis (ex Gao et al. 2016)]GGG60185.1 hypothetical protein GCM10010918_11730 [Paenibacillus radicis (ex Gao et al. 2016)]